MKTTFFVIVGALFIAGIVLVFLGLRSPNESQAQDNIFIENGVQVIEINAKGGYWPRTSVAKANTPSVIKLKTKGTFDCSSAITIPSLNYRTILSPSGETIVDVPPQKQGSVLTGSCSMGMYHFSVEFK